MPDQAHTTTIFIEEEAATTPKPKTKRVKGPPASEDRMTQLQKAYEAMLLREKMTPVWTTPIRSTPAYGATAPFDAQAELKAMTAKHDALAAKVEVLANLIAVLTEKLAQQQEPRYALKAAETRITLDDPSF